MYFEEGPYYIRDLTLIWIDRNCLCYSTAVTVAFGLFISILN